MWSQL